MKKQLDFVTFEILRHRLWQIADEMGITLKRISGSPATTDAGDFVASLHLPNGEVLIFGSGHTLQVCSSSLACKHILERYTEDPGIAEGDMFLFNDPYHGATHQGDVFILNPVFCDHELLGWTATFTHVPDIGSMEPGPSPKVRNVYQEGIRFPGIRIVRDDRVQKDVFDSICGMVREPELVGLEIKAQIAANRVGARRVLELVERYDFATVKAAMEQLPAYSEAKMRERLRGLPDGTWRSIAYLDHDGVSDKIYKIVLAMTKEGDALTFDFTGTSGEASPLGNSPYSATKGGVFCILLPLLCYDIPWNEGALRPVNLVVPDRTLINPKFPAPVAHGSTASSHAVAAASTITIAKMMATSDAYHQEVTAVWRGANISQHLALTDENNRTRLFSMQHQIAAGSGARAFADGVDTGGGMTTTSAVIANIERYELLYPILQLFRRQARDSGGPGKFRGGVGGEHALIPYDAVRIKFEGYVVGSGAEPAVSVGLFGGYPASNFSWSVLRGRDVLQQISQGQLPDSIMNAPLGLERGPAKAHFEFGSQDVFYLQWLGGGGYGDCLDRSPEKVREDVINLLVSLEAARDIYGVAIEGETMAVNWPETERLREEIRLLRVGSGEGFQPASPTYQPPQGSLRLSEYLVAVGLDESPQILCLKCGHSFGSATENWKNHAVTRERPLSVLGPRMSSTARFVSREFYCPGCATMADVEMTLEELPPLWDTELRLPSSG